MSNQQKSALYVLAIGLLTVVAYVTLFIVVSPAVAPAAMAILALTAGVPFLFHDEVVDERERHLALRAGLAGGVAAYLFLIAVCMIVWFIRYRSADPTIDVNVLPVIAMGACVVMMIVRSATLLVLSERPMDVSG